MYNIISTSIRSKLSLRGSSSSVVSLFVPTAAGTTGRTRLAMVHPNYAHQATLSLSMFATAGSATLNNNGGTSSPSNEQRRPFWATRPTEDETKGTATINTVDHSVNAAATTAGISMDDIKKAAEKVAETKKEKIPKKEKVAKPAKTATTPKTKKAKADVDDEDHDDVDDDKEEEDDDTMPILDTDFVSTPYMARVLAKKYKGLSISNAKLVVDDIFSMVIDGVIEKKQVRISRLGIFSKMVQKPKTLTNIHTKEKYSVPAKYRVSFKVSSTFRKAISELDVPAVPPTTK